MTSSRLAGAAALLAVAMATPAMAQQMRQEPGGYAQGHPWANDYNDGYRYEYGYGRSGFWPGDVAAGVIGGVIGTADAIVSAPFSGDDSYAYYGGRVPYDYDNSYAYYGRRPVYGRTVCGLQPGATFLGPDGRWYPC